MVYPCLSHQKWSNLGWWIGGPWSLLPHFPPVPGLAAAQHNPRRPARSSAVAAALPKLGLAISATKNAALRTRIFSGKPWFSPTDNCWLYQKFVGNTHTPTPTHTKKTDKFVYWAKIGSNQGRPAIVLRKVGFLTTKESGDLTKLEVGVINNTGNSFIKCEDSLRQ